MKFTIYQESRIGRRKSNQDRLAYCYSRDALLMVIADGMGGHRHGEIAAHLAVQSVTEAFRREATPTLGEPGRFLSRVLMNAHTAIVDHAFDKDLDDTPRTTIVACVAQDGLAHWAHAGDSRLYLLRDGRVAARTRDHSRVQLMIDQGLLDDEAAAHHPERNRIYSCLGGTRTPQIELSMPTPLGDGDLLALCTDGVWGPVRDQGVVDGLAGTNVMDAVPKLLDRAEQLAGPGCDNLSMIAMCWHDEHDATQDDRESTQTLALDRVTTQLNVCGRARVPAAAGDISDDEIEKAIAEIKQAIHKYSR
ncbi:PP2C family protein-serine/threonine phosphatase [Aromatoleum aromaticum]|uniref:PP2C family protein-serine/threonine phosphatase n=1 Tax=Aromatoleum aromaticum TaxID=551760 RepID=UPI00145956D9|nr:PP2C family serine/threonine-protein phosphatase [Aromatoleum aromaticum]NMG55333.1 SpoIIE family protein phosphatase [Aromatoleum aromaticum]